MNTIRIMIADDHAIMRMGLKTLLSSQPDMKVVGEAESGESATEKCLILKPDIIIMDLMMPGIGGADAIDIIHKNNPAIKIIVLTSFGTSIDLLRAINLGASGALMKESPAEDLIAAIRIVLSGGSAIAKELQEHLNEEPSPPLLTEKQKSVLQSLTRGLSNRDIALQHGITPSGVKRHLRSIFAKIGAATRSEAVAIALKKHLLKTQSNP